MTKTTDSRIAKAKKKLLEFQHHGLKKYGEYLTDQLMMAGDKKSKQVYVRYLKAQVVVNDRRMKSAKEKIKAL